MLKKISPTYTVFVQTAVCWLHHYHDRNFINSTNIHQPAAEKGRQAYQHHREHLLKKYISIFCLWFNYFNCWPDSFPSITKQFTVMRDYMIGTYQLLQTSRDNNLDNLGRDWLARLGSAEFLLSRHFISPIDSFTRILYFNLLRNKSKIGRLQDF